MSRVGKAVITVPSGVEVNLAGEKLTVKGPKGSLTRELPEGITLRKDDATVVLERSDDERDQRSRHGLSRALVANIIIGVTEGYTRELEIIGVGFRAQAKGQDKLELALGFSHPVPYEAPSGITFEVPAPTRVIVKGDRKSVV